MVPTDTRPLKPSSIPRRDAGVKSAKSWGTTTSTPPALHCPASDGAPTRTRGAACGGAESC
eukprot:3887273-Pyramimonas_sp.AAC.1